jgi:hypothetical protein
MNKKSKIVLWVIGIFILLGVIGNANAPKTTVAGIQTATPTITETISVKPTNIPSLTPSTGSGPTAIQKPIYIPATATPTQVITQTQNTTNQPTTSLSNNNYYTNSQGNEVHSPANSTDGSIPVGATAKCGDGTYSFSQSHRGTCSHHGGVAEWY